MPATAITPAPLTVNGRATDADRPWSQRELIYKQHAEWLASSRYVDFPYQIGIESRALCNATCGFCPYPTMKRKGQRMDDALLEKILRDMEDLPRDLPLDVNLARMNEPFADKRVPDLALELERRFPQVSLWIFTNASPLIPKVAAKLTPLRRITQFVISFNDHRPDEYTRVMGLPFERTVANIDALHEMAAAAAVAFAPTISRVGDGTPADDEFLAWCAHRWPAFQHRVTQRFDWIGSVGLTTFGDMPRTGCWQWFHLPILAGGRVAWCTLDHEGDRSRGDVRARHILDIYNEPAHRERRRTLPDRADVAVCSRCNHYG